MQNALAAVTLRVGVFVLESKWRQPWSHETGDHTAEQSCCPILPAGLMSPVLVKALKRSLFLCPAREFWQAKL